MNTKILFYLLLATYINSFSQRLRSIDTLKYDVMIDKKNKKRFRTGMDISIYYANDDNYYKNGDTLVLGNPSGINTVKRFRGYDTRFEYLFYGKPASILLKGIRYVEGVHKDYRVTIEKMQYNKGTMGLENYVFFYVKPLPNKNFTIIDSYITITMVDLAISKGEIFPLNINRPMTRDEAIALLKSKKEEYELDILSKEEYDKIKLELIHIIKNN